MSQPHQKSFQQEADNVESLQRYESPMRSPVAGSVGGGTASDLGPFLDTDSELYLYANVPSPMNSVVAFDNHSLAEIVNSTGTPSAFVVDDNEHRKDPEYKKDLKSEVLVNWLHLQQEERLWTTGGPNEGVFLKKSKGSFVCCPAQLQPESSALYQALGQLGARVAMTVNTRVIKLLLARNEQPWVQINKGLRLQIIPDITSLPYCQKYQSAAFVASSQLLLVWEDDPKSLLDRAQYIQDNLMKMIWGKDQANLEGDGIQETKLENEEWREVLEDGPQTPEERPLILVQAFSAALTVALVLAALGSGWRQIAIEIAIDRNFYRLLLLLSTVPQIWLALFFFQALVGNVLQIIGPTGQVKRNTKFYSGKAPPRLSIDVLGSLPHVTIQMPVYKEGLHAVIEPTIQSIKAAISTYEMQGGTANIFVNDDGMQLLPDDEAKARQDFYDEHGIGWVARPKHNPSPASSEERVFHRRGKFKKASNMNYAMAISTQVEELLLKVERDEGWTQRRENDAYNQALNQVIGDLEGEAWADGNIRMGDYILIIDSDTRVPKDCLLEAVSEMEQSPEVAIIQYTSGVMNVTESFFEKGITFFTNLIYTSIQYAVANGDVAPFVGHNAVLRWAAMQEIAYQCDLENKEKYWSENTVSEDFDMALRLQTAGYIVRFAAYQGQGFKEGVSLTVYDELARWEKYAYGCNELVFHPLRSWLIKGPFTPLFIRFITSRMPIGAKITIMAYIGTYYAIGSAWILTMLNYFLMGWFNNGYLDKFYQDSFSIYFSLVVIFTGLGNVSLAILRYRISEGGGLIRNFWTNFKYVLILVIFLGGVSIHVFQAILSHFLSIDMSWGATAKEVEAVHFFEEIPRVLKSFKGTFLWALAMTAVMIYLAVGVHEFWRIRDLVAIYPMANMIASHVLLPVLLNPNLMLFTW
ncbi:unnamed protein product [Periconia digitata]|uniref:Glycosyltransferase 2-like domain-containing protein n=1 Tax=Periconia digitata TaxID=1303443 RepID=A0A9W4UY41_9PLEO|nr:unnamed protein product [Periconia digitata]